ncbi:MAG: polyprenyl synthetase family protein [Opitutales bacterium]|nr:polyprenyl synthetase family protein [Opitutales bacterium]
MTFDQAFQEYRERVERALRDWFPAGASEPEVLHEAMGHALEAGGKRLRPVLILAAADLFPCRAAPEAAAAAMEMLHTYTLVHDDLPCMDDSPLRRGQPSVHAKYGETVAVLAGDALLTEAFAVLGRGYAEQPEVGLRLVAILAGAGGSLRLIGGQTADTLWEGRRVSAEELDRIHLNKTSALFSAALQMGLTTTEADAATVALGGRIGEDLGLAFQIIDDILDATSDAATLGKQVGGDAAKGKNTYVQLHGIDASRQRARSLTRSALEQCQALSADTAFLEQLIQEMEGRIA